MVVDELPPIVGVDPLQAEGQRLPDLVQGRPNAVFAAPRIARVSPHAVWMSVTLSECANSPSARSPQWATRSSSVNPEEGHVPVIRLQGNVVLEQGPGLGAPVAPRREGPLDRRQAPIDLGGLMVRSCRQTEADKRSRRRAQGSHNGSKALSRTDQG
jgi:hypothetical protein